MEDRIYRSWKEFEEQEYRRCSTFQLSLEELARDLYFDDKLDELEDTAELSFD